MRSFSLIAVILLIQCTLYSHGFPLDLEADDSTSSRPVLEDKTSGLDEISTTDATDDNLGKEESESPLSAPLPDHVTSNESTEEPTPPTTPEVVKAPVEEPPVVKVDVRPLCSNDVCTRYLKEIREDLEESRSHDETTEDVEARGNREPVFDFEDTLPMVED